MLPWVVRVRDVVDAKGIQQAMAFPELPASKRKEFIPKVSDSLSGSPGVLAQSPKIWSIEREHPGGRRRAGGT